MIFEFNLFSAAGFLPSAFKDSTVLENIDLSGANSGNIFVIVINGAGVFLDTHNNNNFWVELSSFATISLGCGVGLGIFAGVAEMWSTIGEETKIGVRFWVIAIINIESSLVIETDVNIGDKWQGGAVRVIGRC